MVDFFIEAALARQRQRLRGGRPERQEKQQIFVINNQVVRR